MATKAETLALPAGGASRQLADHTRPRLFAFDFEPLQEGSVLLVLGPLRTTN